MFVVVLSMLLEGLAFEVPLNSDIAWRNSDVHKGKGKGLGDPPDSSPTTYNFVGQIRSSLFFTQAILRLEFQEMRSVR